MKRTLLLILVLILLSAFPVFVFADESGSLSLAQQVIQRIMSEANASDENADTTSEKSYDKYGIEISQHLDKFPPIIKGQLFDGIEYDLYSTVQHVARSFSYVTQIYNPEIGFQSEEQNVEYARFYLSYYGRVSEKEALSIVDEYTTVIVDVLHDTYPNLTFETMLVSWNIPVIDQDDLYSASYWYNNEDGNLVRSDTFRN